MKRMPLRNPIRLKNLKLRFLPFYLIGLGILLFAPTAAEGWIPGGLLIAAGLTLRGWAAGYLVKNDVLTVAGPYAFLRHPLYLGTIAIGTGFALLVGGWIGAALIGALWPWFAFHYFPRKDRIECQRLEARYGEAFRRYRVAVPALWPRSSAWRPAAIPGIGEPHTATTASDTSPSAASKGWALDRYSDNNELGTLIAASGLVAVLALRMGWIL